MTIYTCHMHPEVEQKKPGKCPRCEMKLVEKGSFVKHDTSNSSYTPLIIIICLILLTSLSISFASGFSFTKFILDFMVGFFLVFSGFKLIDISGFAEGYTTYDLLAKRVYGYGYIYPFIELFFAITMVINFQVKAVLIAEIVVMLFSGIGVAIKLAKHEKFQCACLGTFLKVSLTKVTLIEDFGMALLASVLFLLT